MSQMFHYEVCSPSAPDKLYAVDDFIVCDFKKVGLQMSFFKIYSRKYESSLYSIKSDVSEHEGSIW